MCLQVLYTDVGSHTENMKTFIAITFSIVLIGQSDQSFAGTLEPDTVDNWQIYLGDKLVLSGNASIDMKRLVCDTVSYETLADVKIQFNHCTKTRVKKVEIFITHADKADLNWQGQFKPSITGEYLIPFRELKDKRMKGKIVSFRYTEGDWDDSVILGHIYFK